MSSTFARDPVSNGAFPHNVDTTLRGGIHLLQQGGRISRRGPETLLGSEIFAKQLQIGAAAARAPVLRPLISGNEWANSLIEAGSKDTSTLKKAYREVIEGYGNELTDYRIFLNAMQGNLGEDSHVLLQSLVPDVSAVTRAKTDSIPSDPTSPITVLAVAAAIAMSKSTQAVVKRGFDHIKDAWHAITPDSTTLL